MPLTNVKLIPAKCPSCGADMQVPDKLDKVHCIYCGSEFLISENPPPLNVVVQDNVAAVENFTKLAVIAIQHMRRKEAEEYLDKARELDLDEASEAIKRHAPEFLFGQTLIYNSDVIKFLAQEPIMVAGRCVDAKQERQQINIEVAKKNLDFFFQIGPKDLIMNLLGDDSFKIVEADHYYYNGLMELHKSKFSGSDKLSTEYIVLSFINALEYNPRHAGARDALRRMGFDPDNLPPVSEVSKVWGNNIEQAWKEMEKKKRGS